ncbi:MAG: DUF1573 domain-containing protein [Bacteroidetes bacterium]|nr:MAG: DUF1573 domain-containing protein [Bacteroidota bacterium]
MMTRTIFAALTVASLSMFSCQSTKDAKEGTAATSPATPGATAAAPGTEVPAVPDFQAQAQAMEQTNVQWFATDYNFGTVPTGTKVTHQFRFKNTGDKPLTLTRVKPSCGCTTPSYSKEPVQPGQEGFIDVSFNTAGKSGAQTKTITVTGNFPTNTALLKISGEVTGEPSQQ